MDQRRTEGGEMDLAFVPRLGGQSGSTATVGLGIQLGQLPSPAGVTPQRRTLIADDVEREAGEDGAKMKVQVRYVRFQLAEVAIPPRLFRTILGQI